MNYGIGSYGVSSYDQVCSPVYIVLITREAVVEPGFAFRIFEDKRFQGLAQSFGKGILAHRCAIGWDILKGIGVAVPPRLEQVQILEFLNRETAKLDALIAEQQRLIELLQEKRQAVISHAVTKGLNPDAPMKDSGVEWLGKVPEHWELLQLKRLSRPGSSITYGIVQAGPDIEDGIPYIRTSDMAGDSLSI
jgi:type I restriction enzyme S subunit